MKGAAPPHGVCGVLGSDVGSEEGRGLGLGKAFGTKILVERIELLGIFTFNS